MYCLTKETVFCMSSLGCAMVVGIVLLVRRLVAVSKCSKSTLRECESTKRRIKSRSRVSSRL